MRVAVTGGCGFIGSHVVDHLVKAGHDVLVIDVRERWLNPEADYVIADLFDTAALDVALDGREAVFHLAGASDVNEVAADPVFALRLNVEGVGRVLDAARARGCARVVLASTVWVYGATVGDGERTEDAAVDLRRAGHLYVSTKLAAEMIMHSYHEMYGQEFTILRYGIPYGPRMRDALVVAKFVSAAKEGKPITIAGTGDQQRNFVYVQDLAEAHVLALSPAAVNQTLALEGGTPVTVAEIAETVQHLIREVPVVHVPDRLADYDGLNISNRLAKELLNWSPTTPLAEGIGRYLEWLDTKGLDTKALDTTVFDTTVFDTTGGGR
ncbi:MAG TPA: NAD(P)-dependent oxidoreductase [Streptosporangiaceae bacterium]|nr:NAD(P)-dependent oxidoreductase [Streptosporangiaceae bacterium]